MELEWTSGYKLETRCIKKPKPGNPGSFFPGDAGEEREEGRLAGGLRERGLDFGGEARAGEPKRPKSDGKKRAMSRRVACCRLKRRSRGRARLRDWSEKTKKVMRPPYL